MKYYGYCRVSTDKQETDRQEIALNKYAKEHDFNYDELITEVYTGKTFKRPLYEEMKYKLQKGDVVVVKEVDRLGRDWEGIKEECKWFMDNSVSLIIVDTSLLNIEYHDNSVSTLEDKLVHNQVLELYCYMAQKEREKISQRTKEALAVKKTQGVKLGRPKNEDETTKKVKEMLIDGYGQQKICNVLDLEYGYVNSIKRRMMNEGFNIKNTKSRDYTKISDEEKITIVEEAKRIMSENNCSISVCAEKMNINYRTLYRYIEKYSK